MNRNAAIDALNLLMADIAWHAIARSIEHCQVAEKVRYRCLLFMTQPSSLAFHLNEPAACSLKPNIMPFSVIGLNINLLLATKLLRSEPTFFVVQTD
tara:strand:- start:1867 stop:2157 length:291 start_codon:yes stop_codon:yes gene_type:complete